jgi:membrane-associated phospholipid phosphatase
VTAWRHLALVLLLVPAPSIAASPHPEPRWPRDAFHVGLGGAFLAGSELLDVRVRTVPPEGLDPAELHWSIDRERIGRFDAGAVATSDLASAASLTYPMLVAFATQPPGERTSGTMRRAVVYLESYLFATAASRWLKGSLDRPRPYTYVPAADRPSDATYDVTDEEAFESMPSGHASSSFCGAAFAMTDQLLTRPQAPALERVGVAFGGGLLAGMTSMLRVRAGKHFPSDVLAGGAIGTASGIVVPLTHRYLAGGTRAPLPSRRAWLEALGGMVAGVGAGVLIVEATD